MTHHAMLAVLLLLPLTLGTADCSTPVSSALTYPVVDTGQDLCYDHTAPIAPPAAGSTWDGQDAQYRGNQPAYRDNGDGTITDLVTGLMWVQARGDKVTWEQAAAGARTCRVGGHRDWRMPTIKELYSLIDFRGRQGRTADASVPYLNPDVFDFRYGDEAAGERLIDCQDWSATTYVSTTMGGNPTAFGVNFADGRIKGYPKSGPRGSTRLYIRYVRGNPAYGRNSFVDNRDGTVSDRATGLMWAQADSGRGMDWPSALAFVRQLNAARHLGYSDWRLPDVKELQSIVDYTRIPAIDPVFSLTRLSSGEYPYCWSSTTHLDNMGGAYVCFGRALGCMNGAWQDVHGAGAQRSDPKTGDPARWPQGLGPQGDDIRITNYVRVVRGGAAARVTAATPSAADMSAAQQRGTPDATGNSMPHARPSTAGTGSTMRPASDESGSRPSPGGSVDGSAWVRRLDRDGDHRVSRTEFDGPASAFTDFDRNGDGFITPDEAPSGPPPRRR